MKAPITDTHLIEMMWERFPEIMRRGSDQPVHPAVKTYHEGNPVYVSQVVPSKYGSPELQSIILADAISKTTP